ncbi:MAG: hypothetical protein HYT99_02400, partial [Candidatus Tectomicrobia bacterium]|nr:hypothetical protein [Candidatus Tectomicrobia bacterium]
MRRPRLSALSALLPALLLYGCEGVAITLLGVSSGVAASTAINYTLDGIAYRTFTATRENVRLAALKALSRMGMKLEEDSKRGGRDFIVRTDFLTPAPLAGKGRSHRHRKGQRDLKA